MASGYPVRVDFKRPVEAVIPGVQGRILAVLAETTEELNLRTIARLAGVSSAQASRVLPELVTLGLVARREAPPSALFSLVAEHVAARLVRELSQARRAVLDELRTLADGIDPLPVSVVVFGSLARGDADAESDIDVLLVRPAHVDEDEDGWASSVEEWRTAAGRLTGNSIELLEVGEVDVGRRLARPSGVWADLIREGIAVSGASLADLKVRASA